MSPDVQGLRYRVLFVDDEPRVLLALKAIFRKEYQVLTADGGAAAIELMQNHPVDVIVSDQRMPGMSGLDFLRTARELQPKTIRLLLTGYSDLSAIIGSINEGEIFRFVSKPWSNEKLRETIAAAVDAAALEPISTPHYGVAGVRLEPECGAVGVLLLEDETSTREALREALERERPVYCAATLDEAVTLLERQRIGVLVTAQVVGGEVVTALLSALRHNHPTLVTIVLATQIDAAHTIDLINFSQIFRLLRKPVPDSLLRGTVNLASRRFELLVQHPEQVRRFTAEVPTLAAVPDRAGLFSRIKQLVLRGR